MSTRRLAAETFTVTVGVVGGLTAVTAVGWVLVDLVSRDATWLGVLLAGAAAGSALTILAMRGGGDGI